MNTSSTPVITDIYFIPHLQTFTLYLTYRHLLYTSLTDIYFIPHLHTFTLYLTYIHLLYTSLTDFYFIPHMLQVQVPFDTYFQVEPFKQYHRVMTMEQFMTELAPEIWPPGNRTGT